MSAALRFGLSLHTDRLAPKSEARLPARRRVVYLRDGDALLRSAGQAAGLGTDSAWRGDGEITVVSGANGAILLRWELVAGGDERGGGIAAAGATSSLALVRAIELGDPGGYLMRCDRVDFPPGGIAYTHVHRGPGIRCLLSGAIRVEVKGERLDLSPGEAWFEAGPDPVLALASATERTAFVRVMILPRELKGKTSIRYVRPEDADKPKLQTYRVFADEPIDLP
jgi:quercetin dioxygenase-like cupin family protein